MRFFFAIACLLLCLHSAGAQSPTALPEAPGPEDAAVRFSYDFKPYKLTAFQSEGWNSSEQNAPDEANDVTVFPHPDNTRYYLGGQANIIFQAHPPFHSPYQGPNSFNGAGE
ncbi:MAG TPA: porin, partial [Silvibacterium sp.]|nr:porin [Silvibacterium sp.]